MTALDYLRKYAAAHSDNAGAQQTMQETTRDEGRDFFAACNTATSPATVFERKILRETFPSSPRGFLKLDDAALRGVCGEYKAAVPLAVRCLPCTHPARLVLLNDAIVLKAELKRRMQAGIVPACTRRLGKFHEENQEHMGKFHEEIKSIVSKEIARFADFVAQFDDAMAKAALLARCSVVELDDLPTCADRELRDLIVNRLMKSAAEQGDDAQVGAVYAKFSKAGAGVNKAANGVVGVRSARGWRKVFAEQVKRSGGDISPTF